MPGISRRRVGIDQAIGLTGAISDVTIYCSPFCEISRNAPASLRHANIEPAIVEYMKTPPSRTKLLENIALSTNPERSSRLVLTAVSFSTGT